jgi:hypothetical protein
METKKFPVVHVGNNLERANEVTLWAYKRLKPNHTFHPIGKSHGYGEDLCVDANNSGFSPINSYKNMGREIITYEEFLLLKSGITPNGDLTNYSIC